MPHNKAAVRRDPAPDRRPAAGPLAAMTSLYLEASRLLDRTGVCGARRRTLSQREKVTGRAVDRQIGSTKRGIAMRTAGLGGEKIPVDRHICYAYVGCRIR